MLLRVLIFGIAGGVAGVLGMWTADREPPVRLNDFKVLTPIVSPGGELKIRYDVTRFRYCKVKIERLLVDDADVKYSLDGAFYEAYPGPLGREIYTIPVKIPEKANLGAAEYRTTATYYCNPLHSWFYPIRTVGPVVTFVVGEIKWQR